MPSSLTDHFAKLGRLLDVEREAEKASRQEEIKRLPVSAREQLGVTVSRLTIDGIDSGPGLYPRIVVSKPGVPDRLAPFHGMNQGDNVRLTFPAGTVPPHADGTLDRVEETRASIAIDVAPPDPVPEGRCLIDLLGSDATYKRMKKSLKHVAAAKNNRAAELREIFTGAAEPNSLVDLGQPDGFYNETLNKWQREAVHKALCSPDVSIVHGPPGTGKTTVLVELIRQVTARGERVLASAPSNIAVDNILEKLQGSGLRIVRLGHPARTVESLRHGTLRVQTAEDSQYEQVQEMHSWRERLSRRINRSGSRQIAGKDRCKIKMEIKQLWNDARKLELAISRRICLSAQVVLSTHGGLSNHLLRGDFHWVVMDEASQATEPLSWIPLIKAGRVVFAGDNMQLPPTLFSREAAKDGLAVTLFERLQKLLPKDLQTLLRVQYRMNEVIMGFSSEKFYEGKLIADNSVKKHLAHQLPEARKTELTKKPFIFIDTAGAAFDENLNVLFQSRENHKEAALAVKLAEELLADGIQPKDLAILTPYSAQKKVLKLLLDVPGLEIGTVDGFQGREKEITIVSLVRSNDRGEVGFLCDTRRMNVALTRARRLLIVIGDSVTIAHHKFYKDFLDYAQKKGDYRSAYEWMG